jgi:hypothetical protein
MAKSDSLLESTRGFSLHVEARVVVDLLGMKHPNLVAHLSSYDLTKGITSFLAVEFLPTLGVGLPAVWDGACVGGVSCEVWYFFT